MNILVKIIPRTPSVLVDPFSRLGKVKTSKMIEKIKTILWSKDHGSMESKLGAISWEDTLI